MQIVSSGVYPHRVIMFNYILQCDSFITGVMCGRGVGVGGGGGGGGGHFFIPSIQTP